MKIRRYFLLPIFSLSILVALRSEVLAIPKADNQKVTCTLSQEKQANIHAGCTVMGAIHKRDPNFGQKLHDLWAHCELGNNGIHRVQDLPDRVHVFCCPRPW